ncbi:AAA family ATPase [Dactylosporangium sp. NPDC051541]|uniref:AAA family ATPase n=1 Tax=Dactylosporangium sp. NPDC051541 TaxID=3363977 RepID=UPI00378F84B5
MTALIVLGRPCSGKTTLAVALAEALGRHHVSIGNLIRAARAADAGFRRRSEAAYRGATDFAADDLARLLDAALDGLDPGRVVVDAGPPVDRVAALLGWTGTGTLVVDVDDDTAARRQRHRRHAAPGRVDDVDALFTARLARFRERLPAVVDGLGRTGWTDSVSGMVDPPAVLRQALSIVELRTALAARGEVRTVETAAGFLRSAVPVLGREVAAGPVDVVLRGRHRPGTGNAMVLLAKPRVRLAAAALETVDGLAQGFGYRATRISAWPGPAVARTGAAAAHFDLHGQISRWGSRLAVALEPQLAESTLLGGHEFEAAFGPDALAAAWQEDSANPPRPVGGRFWSLVPAGHPGVLLLNGHMPAVLAGYAAPDSVVHAMLLEGGPDAAPWPVMRRDFLGHTDPARAAPGSLRARATGPGPLLAHGRGTFRNNVFHLSRGPLEAIREAGAWFGAGVLAAVAARLGLARPGLDPATLGVDRPAGADARAPWAFEVTAARP